MATERVEAREEVELRLTPELARRVEAYAARHGIPLLMAQKCLIAAGLDAEESATDESAPDHA